MELFVAYKQLSRRKIELFITSFTIAIGITILISALSLTNGFSTELINKILGINNHILITPGITDKIYNFNSILNKLKNYNLTALPQIKGQALISDESNTYGVLVYGIDITLEKKYNNFNNFIIKGDIANDSNSMLVGIELAKKMGLSIGHKVKVITSIGKVNVLEVSGFFQTGFYEIDKHAICTSLLTAQKIFNYNLNEVNTIAIKLNDPFLALDIANTLKNDFKEFNIKSWQEINKSLLVAISLEKKVIFLVLLFIVIVAMAGVSNILTLNVIEKANEISILRVIGATKVNISKIYIYQGMIIGVLGIIVGLILGLITTYFLSKYPLNLPNDIYYIDKLPVKLEVKDVLWVCLCSFIISVLSSLIPAYKTTKLEPIEILRNSYK